MPISCHNIHNVPCLPSLAWSRNLIPGQHNDGSPSRVKLLGGSQCLQHNKRILAPNTRKLPHPAWAPNPRRTGRRQQERASKQRPPSENGSSLQDAMGDSSGEKPRNGTGTKPQPTHIPNGAWGRGPTSSLSWMVSLHQRGEGGEGGSTSVHKSRAACCQIVTTKPLIETQCVNRKHASLPHDKTEPNSGSVSECVRRQNGWCLFDLLLACPQSNEPLSAPC